MQVSLINIGTSKGIRLPASILKMFDSISAFELHVKGDKIILDTIQTPRKGWEDKFKNSSNELLIDDGLENEVWDDL